MADSTNQSQDFSEASALKEMIIKEAYDQGSKLKYEQKVLNEQNKFSL